MERIEWMEECGMNKINESIEEQMELIKWTNGMNEWKSGMNL